MAKYILNRFARIMRNRDGKNIETSNLYRTPPANAIKIIAAVEYGARGTGGGPDRYIVSACKPFHASPMI